jgi:hypothetical protein
MHRSGGMGGMWGMRNSDDGNAYSLFSNVEGRSGAYSKPRACRSLLGSFSMAASDALSDSFANSVLGWSGAMD